MSSRPNFFIIGAPKSGTTSLASYLGDHQNVFVSTPKELFYFDTDMKVEAGRIRIETEDDYLSLFDGADPSLHLAIGEGSTSYLMSDVALEALLQFQPDARVIAMLRNPVEMVHALHMEFLFSFNEVIEDFEEAWRAQERRRDGVDVPQYVPAKVLQYGDWGRYGVQIERLFRLVPEEQRKIILFDDFKADAAGCYRECLAFLGLPDDGRTEFPVMNSAHEHRSKLIARLVLSPPAMLEPAITATRHFFRENRIAPVEWVKKSLRKDQSRTALREEFQRELEDYFRGDIEKLSGLLGRDLSHWMS